MLLTCHKALISSNTFAIFSGGSTLKPVQHLTLLFLDSRTLAIKAFVVQEQCRWQEMTDCNPASNQGQYEGCCLVAKHSHCLA